LSVDRFWEVPTKNWVLKGVRGNSSSANREEEEGVKGIGVSRWEVRIMCLEIDRKRIVDKCRIEGITQN